MNRHTGIKARAPAVAGQFYPADPAALHRMVEECIAQTDAGQQPPGSGPRAVISPHAGYAYSGWLAGVAWNATAGLRPRRVVILSPSHRHGFDGIALSSADTFSMPGFDVPVDQAARQALANAGLAHIEDAAHDREHGIETQLPFLHSLHPKAEIVPLAIGRTTTDHVAQVIDFISEMDGLTLFVLSSDLSHFLTLDAARTRDLETAKLIETGQYDRLTPAHACGVRAVAGYMASRQGQGARVQRLAMANSYDRSGDASRTVGYGAWALFGTEGEIIPNPHRTELLNAAREALQVRLRRGYGPETDDKSFAAPLQGHAASFVTLTIDRRLRGCIGSLRAHRPLIRDVVENTLKSAFNDPRFQPITQADLDRIRIKIAVLSPSREMRFSDQDDLVSQLEPGKDGLILSDKGRRGTFLPMVWDSLPEPRVFLDHLKVKAGLPRDHWSDSVTVHRYRAESFAEDD